MPAKSIFRQPGAQHFRLVHRSQRDPLIHDPEASQHVLKAFERENVRKGKTRADLEKSLSPNELANDGRANLGEASLYDIYYDDTEYDYMQHLRPINNGENQEDGVESILLPAPAVTKFSRKGKAPADPSNFLKHPSESSQIPSEALPSSIEVERDYESQMAVPSSIAGFQPDMNVHLRQTLEALENDAFLDDEVEDDFFVELLKEGERDDGEDVDFGFEESDLENNEARLPVPTIRESSSGSSQVDDNWMVRFAQFKREEAQNVGSRSEADEPGGSEDRDTVSGLPKLLVRGGKRRRKGASDASGYSLSSSSMFRNKGLSTLDEQFAELELQYASSDDEDEEDSDEGGHHIASGSSAGEEDEPKLLPPREDFYALLDDFLDRYELVGGKVRPVLAGATGTEKLETFRRAMAGGVIGDEDLATDKASQIREILSIAEKQYQRTQNEHGEDHDSDEDIPTPSIVGMGKGQDRWDVETILSTYSNLENHPRIIKANPNRPQSIRTKPIRIQLDRRTGLPKLVTETELKELSNGSDDGMTSRPARQTIIRPRDETKEQKKVRKQAVQEERQARRVKKQLTKEAFLIERSRQHRIQGRKAESTRKL